jgi:hypothetical protein
MMRAEWTGWRRPAATAALLLLAACFAMVITAMTSNAQPADSQCSVGAPPTIEEKGPPPLRFKPSSPELVIACGKSVVGPFEIVAYTAVRHHWLCTFVLGPAFGGSECGGALNESRLARDGVLITGSGATSGSGPGRSYTTLHGWVRSDVARIEVRYHRRNEKTITRASATVAQVNGELLSSLDQATPFGRFAVVLPGCTRSQGIRVLALDSEGRMIGSERGRKARFGGPCQP